MHISDYMLVSLNKIAYKHDYRVTEINRMHNIIGMNLKFKIAHSKYGSIPFKANEGILMQFTGLQDCNGVDIYEGDIIELWYEICSGEYREYSDKGMVCFENGLFKIKCIDEQQEYDFDFFHHVDDSTKEVIGNIYENPELLEVE